MELILQIALTACIKTLVKPGTNGRLDVAFLIPIKSPLVLLYYMP